MQKKNGAFLRDKLDFYNRKTERKLPLVPPSHRKTQPMFPPVEEETPPPPKSEEEENQQ